jgi:hypothetical protein
MPPMCTNNGFVDTVRCVDGKGRGVLVLADRAVGKSANDQNQQESDEAQQEDFNHPPKLARHDLLVSFVLHF